jgi:polar amino acid transport system substrate-binding protein
VWRGCSPADRVASGRDRDKTVRGANRETATMRKVWLSLGIALALAAGAGIAAAETLRVGAYAANPPWEVKQVDGSFEGFEVDLVDAIAERLGLEVDYEDMGFQAFFAATSSGRIDAAISSITITDERLESQSFTQGYYDADMALATNRESGITGLADMEGEAVGVLSGSTGERWVQENMEEYGFSEVRGYNAYPEMLLDTQLGRVAGAVSDVTGLIFAFEGMPQLHVVERIETGDRYGMMMGKDHPMLGAINDTISELKEDGTMAAIYARWFGEDAEPGPSTLTPMPVPTSE